MSTKGKRVEEVNSESDNDQDDDGEDDENADEPAVSDFTSKFSSMQLEKPTAGSSRPSRSSKLAAQSKIAEQMVKENITAN